MIPALMRFFILSLFFSFSYILQAQDSNFVQIDKNFVLNKIASLQVKNHPFFDDGLFRSYYYFINPKKIREDNCIISNSMIAVNLQYVQSISEWPEGDTIMDSIIHRIRQNYWHYEKRRGGITFNAWQTKPIDNPIPNTNYPKFIKDQCRAPEDLDCTSMAYASLDDRSLFDSLKVLMGRNTNLNNGLKLKIAPKNYRSKKDIYLQWFSKIAIQHIDIGSMSNYLLFSFKQQLPINKYDSATIAAVKEMIISKDYLEKAHMVSNGYQLPTAIFFHLCQMMNYAGKSYFEDVWDLVLNDLKILYENSDSEFEKMCYSLCMMKLGVASNFEPSVQILKELPSFRAGRISALVFTNYWFIKHFGNHRRLTANAVCEGLNWSIFLEYLVLKENFKCN